ncbi:hypothetical protein ACLMJK_009476 [Lecanora helva]
MNGDGRREETVAKRPDLPMEQDNATSMHVRTRLDKQLGAWGGLGRWGSVGPLPQGNKATSRFRRNTTRRPQFTNGSFFERQRTQCKAFVDSNHFFAAMACNMPTPIIVETPSSPTTPSPASLAPSPEPASSSSSNDSSRPQSQHSSNTSVTRSPTPCATERRTPEEATSQDEIELSTLAPPALPPLSTPSPDGIDPSDNPTPPTNPPSPTYTNRTQESGGSYQSSWLQTLRIKVYKNRWLEITLGAMSVAVALWMGVRGYKLAVWDSWNGMRQTCAAYIQSNVTIGSRCTEILRGDPPAPPYRYSKWGVDLSNSAATRFARRGLVQLCVGSRQCDPGSLSKSLNLRSSIYIISVFLVLGLLFIRKARGKTENEEVFTSPAKVQVTRHFDDGKETISGQGVITKKKPEDHDYPEGMRRRVRRSLDESTKDSTSAYDSSPSSQNTSAETLVASVEEIRKPSRVSIHDHSADEKHEGLIELQVCGKRKAFFKPSTGEFFHISPWKSTHSDDDSSDEEHIKKKAEKDSTHRTLGKMVIGGVSWVIGKQVDEKLAEKLEEVTHHKWYQPTQSAGDSLAGEATS